MAGHGQDAARAQASTYIAHYWRYGVKRQQEFETEREAWMFLWEGAEEVTLFACDIAVTRGDEVIYTRDTLPEWSASDE